jgi:hypothetical protein
MRLLNRLRAGDRSTGSSRWSRIDRVKSTGSVPLPHRNSIKLPRVILRGGSDSNRHLIAIAKPNYCSPSHT